MARRALLRACVCVLDSKFSISSVIPGPTNLEFMLNCTLGRPLAAVSERSASWSITWGKHLDEEPIREAFRGTGPDFLILRPLSLVQGAISLRSWLALAQLCAHSTCKCKCTSYSWIHVYTSNSQMLLLWRPLGIPDRCDLYSYHMSPHVAACHREKHQGTLERGDTRTRLRPRSRK